MRLNASSAYYPDIKVLLITIPLISAFNYYLTYTNIQFNSFLLLTYAIDTIQGYIAWLSVRWTILKLDRNYPYSRSITGRIVIQTITTTALGLTVIILLTELVSWIARGRPALPNFYTTDLFIISIWFLVINAFYVVLHFHKEWQQSQQQHEDLIKARTDYIMVKLGQKEIKIPFQEIDLICVNQGLTEILTDHRTVKCLLTLDSLENQLPELDFFRVNRQLIINRKVFGEFTKLENGKIKVLLSADHEFNSAIISRTRAPKFKRWLKLE